MHDARCNHAFLARQALNVEQLKYLKALGTNMDKKGPKRSNTNTRPRQALPASFEVDELTTAQTQYEADEPEAQQDLNQGLSSQVNAEAAPVLGGTPLP